jgi:hypothetical protein
MTYGCGSCKVTSNTIHLCATMSVRARILTFRRLLCSAVKRMVGTSLGMRYSKFRAWGRVVPSLLQIEEEARSEYHGTDGRTSQSVSPLSFIFYSPQTSWKFLFYLRHHTKHPTKITSTATPQHTYQQRLRISSTENHDPPTKENSPWTPHPPHPATQALRAHSRATVVLRQRRASNSRNRIAGRSTQISAALWI